MADTKRKRSAEVLSETEVRSLLAHDQRSLTVISCPPDGVLVLLFPFGHAQGVFGVSQVAAVHRVGPGLMEDPDQFHARLFQHTAGG